MASQRANADALTYEPARDLRHPLLGICPQHHESVYRTDDLPERLQSLQDLRVRTVDLQLQLPRPLLASEGELVHNAATLEKGYAIARGLDFAEKVRVQEDGRSGLSQLLHQIAHQHPSEGIESGGRLIEKQQLRCGNECLSQTGTLQHALAEFGEPSSAGIGEIDALEQCVDPPLERCAPKPVEASVDTKEFANGEGVVKPKVFRQEADTSAGRAVTEPRTEDQTRSGGRRDEAEQHLDGCRLAGSVGAQEAENLAPANL